MKHTYLILAIICLCFACKPLQLTPDPVPTPEVEEFGAFILEEALMTCFPEGTKFDDGKDYNCEFSAAAMYEGSILLGNDKNTSAVSPMMLANGESLKKGEMDHPFELKQKEFFNIYKIEDFAFTPDKKTLFITSGFDRLKDDSNEWDLYNCLLAWDVKEDKFQMVSSIDNDGVVSSKDLRAQFKKMLGNTKHMKIEGLMILPGNRIIFGVRETGNHFEDPIYTTTFIECNYRQERGRIFLTNSFKISYTMETSSAREDLGLSSLFYDTEQDAIYFSTSFEGGDEGMQELGGYIWRLPMADYIAKKPAQLIKKEDGTPLALRHKVEAITKMDDGNFIVIYDNDRTDIPVRISEAKEVSRAKNECVYSIVKLP